MSNLVAVSDMQVMADAIVKSGFYGFKTKEQVMAVMLVAQAEQKHPATVVQEYDIIQGRPALKSQAMLARFQLAGGKVEWHEVSPKKCTGTFSHHSGGSLKVEWTIEMAKQAGVFRDGSGWTKYPEDMLRARVISRGVRAVYPACILGHYAVEEVADFDNKPPKDMGMAQRVDDIPPPPDDIIEEADGAFKLYVPGAVEPYAAYHTMDEWIQGYCELIAKIYNSAKLMQDEKEQKLTALDQENKRQLDKLDSFAKIKIRSNLVQLGVPQGPKQGKSPSSAEQEPSEETS